MRLKEFIDPNKTLQDIVKSLDPALLKGTAWDKGDTPTTSSTPNKSGKTRSASSAPQDTDYNKKLVKVANALGIDPADLRAIIYTESRHNPQARNRIAGGLIGFTDRTARGLGTTLPNILKMSAVEQLDLVYQFYKNVGVKPGMKRGEIYMLTFMPAYANAPDNTVLGQKGGGQLGRTGLSKHAIWDQNPAFGKSKGKKYFTVADVKNTINSVA
jgi:hypothetical protein